MTLKTMDMCLILHKKTRILNVADCGYYNIIIMYAFCDVKYIGANQINLWSETIEFQRIVK